jgi:disulfide bond formation protein DsbB
MISSGFRPTMFTGFLACVAAMGFALYLQYGLDLEPCPMCIFQRIAMMTTGLLFLIGFLHGPRGNGRWVYALAAAITAAIGAGVAARQVWLQSLPEDEVPACGPTLGYLMKMMPLQRVVEKVLKGDGSCAKIAGEWLGITLPGWTCIGFVLLVLLAFGSPLIARRMDRRLAAFP